MKPMAFFRNTWKKKNKDKNMTERKQDVSAPKQTLVAPKSAPCTPTALTFEIPAGRVQRPLPDHKVRSQSQSAVVSQVPATFSRKTTSVCSIVDGELSTPSSPIFLDHYDLGCSPRSPVVWKSSHGPPENLSHGPPNLSLHSPVFGTLPKSAGGTSSARPPRPPRPPPLNLYHTTTKRPVNTGIPTRFMANRAITFALPPNPRAINPVELTPSEVVASSPDYAGASEDREETASESSEETARCICATISPKGNRIHSHRGALDSDVHATVNLPLPPRHGSLPLLSSPRAAHTILDLSDTPLPRRVYQNGLRASSTPHLLSHSKEGVPPIPPLHLDSPSEQAEDGLNFPLSLFPTPPPPPLFIRRKIPKNLVLEPRLVSSDASLPPPATIVSPDHTPLTTPTTPRHHTSPNPKSPSRYPSPRLIPPLLYDPPSTPLPTPPTSPSPSRGRGASPLPPLKPLRSVKSTSQLRPAELFIPPAPPLAHRATSSEPLSLPGARRRVQSRPEERREAQLFVSGANK